MSRSNQRGAMSLYAAAVALEPKNAANWVGFVKAVKAITPKDYTERYQLRERGTAAAYVAYQRATTRPAEAEALALLGDLYVMSEDWRPALNAYAASLQLADEPALRKTYEELREKRGFRITNYKVELGFRLAAGVLQLLGAAGPGARRLRALRCGVRRGERRDHDRELAALRRRPEARRALRLRAPPGPAVVRRREPSEVGGLRGLCPRPLAAGSLHRPQLRPAAHRPGGHPARLGQHRRRRGRDLPHRRPQPPADGALRGVPRPDQPLRGRDHRDREGPEDLVRHRSRRSPSSIATWSRPSRSPRPSASSSPASTS